MKLEKCNGVYDISNNVENEMDILKDLFSYIIFFLVIIFFLFLFLELVNIIVLVFVLKWSKEEKFKWIFFKIWVWKSKSKMGKRFFVSINIIL